MPGQTGLRSITSDDVMTTYIWALLVSLDQLANVAAGPLLNMILRPTVARFGDPDETLSSVMGKNVEAGACIGCRLICLLLHRLDPGHCEKSIERDEGLN